MSSTPRRKISEYIDMLVAEYATGRLPAFDSSTTVDDFKYVEGKIVSQARGFTTATPELLCERTFWIVANEFGLIDHDAAQKLLDQLEPDFRKHVETYSSDPKLLAEAVVERTLAEISRLSR